MFDTRDRRPAPLLISRRKLLRAGSAGFASMLIPWLGGAARSAQAQPMVADTSNVTELVNRRRVSERLIGQISAHQSVSVSPDNRRIAYVASVSNKQCVVVDGKEGKQYDRIGKESGNVFYGGPIFSPDSQRVAYVASKAEKWLVVVDEKEQRPFDDIYAPSLIFSPDSRRTAYEVGIGDRQAVVIDGEKQNTYDKVAGLLFSPDGRRVAYWAAIWKNFPSAREGKWVAVIDGKEQEPNDNEPVFGAGEWAVFARGLLFSPNSQRVAYTAVHGPQVFAVIDGKQQRPYGNIYDGPIFSPDSRRVMYRAVAYTPGAPPSHDFMDVVIVDGKEQKRYLGIPSGTLHFSPNSRRTAYVAWDGEKMFVVVDGKEGKHYAAIAGNSNQGALSLSSVSPTGLVFSPDSKRVAYVASEDEPTGGEKWFAVVDGNEGQRYDGIDTGSLIFSRDCRRVAYVATVKEPNGTEKWFAVVDGKPGKSYEGIVADPAFSPDSARLAYGVKNSGSRFVVLDDDEGKPYDEIAGTITFDTAQTLHYLAGKRTEKSFDYYLVEEMLH